jgi:hypothetical protein
VRAQLQPQAPGGRGGGTWHWLILPIAIANCIADCWGHTHTPRSPTPAEFRRRSPAVALAILPEFASPKAAPNSRCKLFHTPRPPVSPCPFVFCLGLRLVNVISLPKQSHFLYLQHQLIRCSSTPFHFRRSTASCQIRLGPATATATPAPYTLYPIAGTCHLQPATATQKLNTQLRTAPTHSTTPRPYTPWHHGSVPRLTQCCQCPGWCPWPWAMAIMALAGGWNHGSDTIWFVVLAGFWHHMVTVTGYWLLAPCGSGTMWFWAHVIWDMGPGVRVFLLAPPGAFAP